MNFFSQKNGSGTFEIQESDDTIDDVPWGLKQKIDKPKEKQEIVDGGGLPRKKEDSAPLLEVLEIVGNADCSNDLNALQFGGSIDDISDIIESKTFGATGKSEWDHAKIEEIEALQKQDTVFSTSLDLEMATSVVLIAMSFSVTKGVIGVCTCCPFGSRGTKDWSNHGDLTIWLLFGFVVLNLVFAAVMVREHDSHHWEKEINQAEEELQRLM
ncbi:hypothetical protein M0R45_034140 [Rubus argutus]|uniref:Uncharacterized protein n=1 Tax=Rubus argutus TaxID=59490 RepID=A0AAW1VSY8_RUBAR